jgi:hypothetical protein
VSNFPEGVARHQCGKWMKFHPASAFSKFCLVSSFLSYRPLTARDSQTLQCQFWGVIDRVFGVSVGLDCPR